MDTHIYPQTNGHIITGDNIFEKINEHNGIKETHKLKKKIF